LEDDMLYVKLLIVFGVIIGAAKVTLTRVKVETEVLVTLATI
jgi:hypothetical protein